MPEPARIVPSLDGLSRAFWTGGSRGELMLSHCQACQYWIHPPKPLCPRCHERDLRWEPTSGVATLFSYTVNFKAWNPKVPVPYVLGIVELPEQAGLRLTTNIVNCSVDDIEIGMRLRVNFEQHGEVFVPLFEPAASVERLRTESAG
ncbi:MAG: DNA-binding protein [Acidimicrobiales bacterium]|nr:DNA-binding protein [Acidimicrobiales bacterium]